MPFDIFHRLASRERCAHRGARIGSARLRAVLGEIRQARVGAGVSQQRVAQEVGISRSRFGRVERAEVKDIDFVLLSTIASVLGLDLALRAYPAGPRVRDAGHLKLLARLQSRLGPLWSWSFEVPFPRPDDLRAWDAVPRYRDVVVACEAEVKLHDIQALIRREQIKKRDGGVGRLILVVSDTKENRQALRAAEPIIRTVFPVGPRRAMAALRAGHDPGGDALIVV